MQKSSISANIFLHVGVDGGWINGWVNVCRTYGGRYEGR